MPIVLVTTAVQALGLLAVLVGVAMAAPTLAAALVLDGLLVVALGVAVEYIVRRRPGKDG